MTPKQLREEYNLTQVEFARRINLSERTVRRAEAGCAGKTADVLYGLLMYIEAKHPRAFRGYLGVRK